MPVTVKCCWKVQLTWMTAWSYRCFLPAYFWACGEINLTWLDLHFSTSDQIELLIRPFFKVFLICEIMSLIFDNFWQITSPPKFFLMIFIFELIPIQKFFPYSVSVIFVDGPMEGFSTPKLCSMLLVKHQMILYAKSFQILIQCKSQYLILDI